MPGAAAGVFVIAFGLLVAPSGLYFVRICYAVAGLLGFYIGVRAAATAPPIDAVREIPFGTELVYGLSTGLFSVALLVVLFAIAGVLLPISYGLHLGARLFSNPLLVYLVTVVVGLVGFTLFFLGIWVVSAAVGGVLVAVGVQFVFPVAGETAAPYGAVAEWLRSVGVPAIVPEIVVGIGAIGRSGILFGIAGSVAVAGIAGHLFVLQQVVE
ncbi:hypothetical protein GRX03_09645 [Halovenus sp. WSH3]|uniref:Uncharacterized protein n=1 Tax=Halovenus carboxidivorans TaxID=2692199 RepID=A0A6B0T6P8_9EURY|nr:hypothetical protein [Halovenus carboxidivorans]MXR51866.1 hypothetical protein [Halovenus carboxidivorans]